METVRPRRDSTGILCNAVGRNTMCETTTPFIPADWIIPLIVNVFGLWLIRNVRELWLVGVVPVVRLDCPAGCVGCNDCSGGNSEVFHLVAGSAASNRTRIACRIPLHPSLHSDPDDCSKLATEPTSIVL